MRLLAAITLLPMLAIAPTAWAADNENSPVDYASPKLASGVSSAAPAPGALIGGQPPGPWFPTAGRGKGDWEISLGARFWTNEFHLRNLIAQGDLDLGPGVRAHALARHNRKLDSLGGFDPNLDEAYLEAYGFYTMKHARAAGSIRVGKVRYLHFPYPDAIAYFDQVPGVADLKGGEDTGYSGAVAVGEFAHDSGLGVHFSGIAWGLGHESGANAIEDYAFYRKDVGILHFEARGGGIASRKEPLGGSPRGGFDVFLGANYKGYAGGVLYEKRHDEQAFTGVMVVFRNDAINRALGKVGFDYTREPDSFSVQVPLVHGKFGFAKEAPAGQEPVGEMIAVFDRTYWQAGLIRNFYEHRIAKWGETSDPGLMVTREERPLYLWGEALVSPHTTLNSKWFDDRQGPAHNARVVVYRFYRRP